MSDPIKQTKTERLSIRCSDDDAERIERAAAIAGYRRGKVMAPGPFFLEEGMQRINTILASDEAAARDYGLEYTPDPATVAS